MQQGYQESPPKKKKITLRDYQLKNKNEIRSKYAHGVKRVLYVLPTGGGKTVVFSDIAFDVSERKKYVLVLAHRIELLEQCGGKLEDNGVDFGYLNPKYTEKRSSHVQVGTMQTVIRRLEKLGIVPDLIIIDEAHRAMSKTYRDIIAHFPKSLVLGVTGTPVRGDGKCLGDLFEDMVIGPSYAELIARGALVNPDVYAPLGHLDLTGVPIVRGDYDKQALAKKLDRSGITGDAVGHYKSICPGAPAVAFCVSINHAKHVAADFRSAGYVFEHIDGTMPHKDTKDKKTGKIIRGRISILNDLKTGKIHGITSVDLITEGFDAPMLICAIMLRPTKSEGLYLQMAGRILRPYPGKEFAIILDHAGLTITHDLVTEDRLWTLDEVVAKERRKAKEREKQIKIKQCPKCFHCHTPLPSCPKCGHVYVITGREPDQQEGHLTKITAESAKLIKEARRKEVSKAKTLEELKDIEKLRGYKGRLLSIEAGGLPVEGWAEHVFYSRNNRHGMV